MTPPFRFTLLVLVLVVSLLPACGPAEPRIDQLVHDGPIAGPRLPHPVALAPAPGPATFHPVTSRPVTLHPVTFHPGTGRPTPLADLEGAARDLAMGPAGLFAVVERADATWLVSLGEGWERRLPGAEVAVPLGEGGVAVFSEDELWVLDAEGAARWSEPARLPTGCWTTLTGATCVVGGRRWDIALETLATEPVAAGSHHVLLDGGIVAITQRAEMMSIEAGQPHALPAPAQGLMSASATGDGRLALLLAEPPTLVLLDPESPADQEALALPEALSYAYDPLGRRLALLPHRAFVATPGGVLALGLEAPSGAATDAAEEAPFDGEDLRGPLAIARSAP